MKKRLIIVSNRLPVTLEKKKGGFTLKESVGGLATGVKSFYGDYDSMWIGWGGVPKENTTAEERRDISARLQEEHRNYPIFLTKNEIRNFYHGFCNRTIWPLFHYFPTYTTYDAAQWESYRRVNARFADAVATFVRPGDTLWIHDYQLMLLPEMIRQREPEICIGFFLHIPFPSFEVFRLLPWRREILEGLLGAHLVGFHTYDYARHFHSSVRRLLGYEYSFGTFTVGDHITRVDVFPMGIDFDHYFNASDDPGVRKEIQKVEEKLNGRKLIFSVDRLDYTKGILHRLSGFDSFLKRYPEYVEKVVLILVAVPSRTGVDTYRALKQELDEHIGRINGQYGSLGWVPVWYLYRFLPFHELTALYNLADVALITPLRDGMNLIAKEYVAAKKERGGVLVLSGMAGAASELSEAIIVNPNNQDQVAEALKEALEMDEAEQVERLRTMQKRIRRYDVVRWAHDFLEKLDDVWTHNKSILERKLVPSLREKLIRDYRNAKKRLLILDYEGTLTPVASRVSSAKPDERLRQTLRELLRDGNNEIVVISRRDREVLTGWFDGLDVGMIAEHGVWVRDRGGAWNLIESARNDWMQEVHPLLELYMDRTPGSTIEVKEYSLIWHYRRSDPDLALQRVNELKENLMILAENLNVGIMEGNRSIEIRNYGTSKEDASLHWLSREEWDFILFMGDDVTDEHLFISLPDFTYSIKVGLGVSNARFNVGDVDDALSLLDDILGSSALEHLK
jgi:trehalose 6-phosphate synthase/phosphatase